MLDLSARRGQNETPLGNRETGTLRSYQDLYDLILGVSAKLDEICEYLSNCHKAHYTVQEAARAVGRTDYTIRRHIADGVINAVRAPGSGPKGRLLVPRAELQRLVALGRGGRANAAIAGD